MKKKSWLLTASSFPALCAVLAVTSPVSAQSNQTADNQIETVTVSASRISLAGYQQPTPVTVVDTAALERDAPPDLAQLFHNLPTVGVALSPDTQQGAQGVSGASTGESQINLRNLGVQRTLVLIDGNRVVAGDISPASSGVDLNNIPSMLIKRIDIVTGGASAAWGSDAVAGVVNFIMDNDFEGFKANVEGSANEWGGSFGEKDSAKIEAAYGTSFLGGRGHIVLAATYFDSPLSPRVAQAPWNTAADIVTNPAYTATNNQPQLITVRGVGLSNYTAGGAITTGPLAGTQFVGPNGAAVPFQPGNVSGQFAWGGSAPTPIQDGLDDLLSVPVQNVSLYGHASYDIFSNVAATAEFEYGESQTHNSSIQYQTTDTIGINNPYLIMQAPQIVAEMQALGISSFALNTTNAADLAPGSNPNTLARNELGTWGDLSERTLYRGVVGLNGSFGDDWTWNGAYQHSTNHVYNLMDQADIVANYNNAVNAVYVTAGNVGSSGLPIGSIACASTLTNPTNGCAPLNVLGNNVASQAAINYINPPPGSPNVQHQDLILAQDTVSLSLQGKPFSLWAGPVAVAIGFDYRKEAATQTAGALSYAKAYAAGNFQPFQAEYNTKEGFGEINAPLLKDQWVQSLDLDVAGRITDYSTSGMVETWKLGLVSQVNDDLRFRTSWSLDIRAADLYELFNPGSFSGNSTTVPGQTLLAGNLLGGNPNLKPEISTTLSGGMVLTPHWVPGLSFSADWYSISIKDAIFTPSNIQVLDQCALGVAAYCAALVKNSTGQVIQIDETTLNAAEETTSGLDFQGNYSHDLFEGNLSVSLQGNYMDEETTTSALGTIDTAGSLNVDAPYGSGAPKLRVTLAATYDQGPWSGTVQTRLIGAGHVSNQFHEGSGPESIDNNDVPAIAYLDLRGSYTFANLYGTQLYVAVDNVLDLPPPLVPNSSESAFPGFYPAMASNFYDTLGRMWRGGVRIQF